MDRRERVTSAGLVDPRVLQGWTPRAVERIALGFSGMYPGLEAEHIARYRWAAKYMRDANVLDVACGTGYGAKILFAAGARRVTSVDLSFHAIEFGVRSYNIAGLVGNAHLLPFKNGVFEGVVSLETLEHLAHPEMFIGELARVLRPRGVLTLSTPNLYLSDGTNPYHLREFSLRELLELLRKWSLRPLEVWGQEWRLRSVLFHRVRGLRRLAFRVSQRPAVTRRLLGADPRYWCVTARREPSAHNSAAAGSGKS
jgi:SAM-dependent methyltransferase